MRGGVEEPRAFTLSRGRLLAVKIAGLTMAALFVAMAASWFFVARRAATATAMKQEYDSLVARHGRMDSLANRLAGLEARQDGFRRLMGVASSRDSALWLGNLGTGAGRRRRIRRRGRHGADGLAADDAGFSSPSPTGAWATTPESTSRLRAAPTSGAAGGGVVVDAANDPVYGLFVLIDHGDGWRTRYGHASYLVAERGWNVRQGEVIALSGSTGRSTAPHLHFEILSNGRPIDPLSMVTPP